MVVQNEGEEIFNIGTEKFKYKTWIDNAERVGFNLYFWVPPFEQITSRADRTPYFEEDGRWRIDPAGKEGRIYYDKLRERVYGIAKGFASDCAGELPENWGEMVEAKWQAWLKTQQGIRIIRSTW